MGVGAAPILPAVRELNVKMLANASNFAGLERAQPKGAEAKKNCPAIAFDICGRKLHLRFVNIIQETIDSQSVAWSRGSLHVPFI